MKADERVIRFFECRLSASIRYGAGKTRQISKVTPVTLAGALQEAESLLKTHKKSISLTTDDKRMGWRIADIEIDLAKNRAIILVNRSDADAANLAIENMQNGTLRIAKKNDEEANAYSAHAVFSLKPLKNGAYSVLVEQVGISSKIISRLLSEVVKVSQFNESKTFMYEHPDGAIDKAGGKRLLKGMYKFELGGKLSSDLIKQLDKGELTGVELVEAANTTKNWDSYNATKEKSRVIRLGLMRTQETNWRVVKSLLDKAQKENKKELVVRFNDEEGDGRTLTWDVENSSLLNEDRFVERTYIRNFANKLDTGCESINIEVRDKMYYHLR